MTTLLAEPGCGISLREQTCCLTGHRIIPPGEESKIMTRTRNILLKLIREKDVRYFGVGGAVGFDMLAAEYLISLRESSESRLKIVSVLPWPGWRETEDWTDELRAREEAILTASDKVVYVSPQYEKSIFLRRDRRLVDESAYCVSYCNRPRTGTAYTVRYALGQGVKVFNASSFDIRSL